MQLKDLPLPMEPIKAPEPFDRRDWLFEPKWDGVRYLIRVTQGETRLFNRRLRDKTLLYPEFSRLSDHLEARGAIMDGEMTALRHGRPCFQLILRRDLRKSPLPQPPATLALFDLLSLEGRDLTPVPLRERKRLLEKVVRSGSNLLLVKGIWDKGEELFRDLCRAGWEGVVAKRGDSPYVPGKSGHWVKIKCSREIWAPVVGISREAFLHPGKGSLAVAQEIGGELVYAGRVRSGISDSDWLHLVRELPRAGAENPPCSGVPRDLRARILWLRPVLGVRVRFLEWTPQGRLRAPRVLDYRPWREVTPDEKDHVGTGKLQTDPVDQPG